VAIDGNGRRVACDPYRGAIEAVLECAANLACAGAEPLGLTNCLNFGNPEKPHVAWQLERTVVGLAEACEALAVPVVGGNVSLYNEAEEGPIYPTPVVGMVGELPDPARAPGVALSEGDALALIGSFEASVAGSELAKQRGELGPGLPEVDVGAVARTLAFVRDAVRGGGIAAAHDVSDGGLACALAECAIAGEVGIDVELGEAADAEAVLFGEGPGRFVLAGAATAIERVVEKARDRDIPAAIIGGAGGEAIRIVAGGTTVELALDRAARAWGSLGERVGEVAEVAA
jgi:phosphoribosylformylglycinamidine synthase